MLGVQMRQRREAAGLTQTALAQRAGVSRQLVGAVEAGRHVPRVDAAAALARALGTTIDRLLGAGPDAPLPVLGELPPVGSPVRLGRVGDRLVVAPLPDGGPEWASADAVLTAEGLELLPDAVPGALVVGCDPAIDLAGQLAGVGTGGRVRAVAASTEAALQALAAAATHAVVVHGDAATVPEPTRPVRRWHLARWQVGVAAAAPGPGWWRQALSGRQPVVQREAGARAQDAFVDAVHAAGGDVPPGPRAGGHLEAARWALGSGLAAVTIEPAARRFGLDFRALATHTAELWVDAAWCDEPPLPRLGEVLASAAFQRRLGAVGGYDLSDCGRRLA